MDMDVGVAVRIADLLVIDFRQPVVRGNRAGVRQDQSADRIRDGRVLFDTPVRDLQIVVDDLLIVHECRGKITETLTLLTIKDVSLRHIVITGFDKHGFDRVLDLLDLDLSVLYLAFKVRRNLQA